MKIPKKVGYGLIAAVAVCGVGSFSASSYYYNKSVDEIVSQIEVAERLRDSVNQEMSVIKKKSVPRYQEAAFCQTGKERGYFNETGLQKCLRIEEDYAAFQKELEPLAQKSYFLTNKINELQDEGIGYINRHLYWQFGGGVWVTTALLALALGTLNGAMEKERRK